MRNWHSRGENTQQKKTHINSIRPRCGSCETLTSKPTSSSGSSADLPVGISIQKPCFEQAPGTKQLHIKRAMRLMRETEGGIRATSHLQRLDNNMRRDGNKQCNEHSNVQSDGYLSSIQALNPTRTSSEYTPPASNALRKPAACHMPLSGATDTIWQSIRAFEHSSIRAFELLTFKLSAFR